MGAQTNEHGNNLGIFVAIFFNLAEQQQSGESFDQELFFRLFNLTFPFHALHKEKFNSYKQIENVRKCCLNCRNTAHENSDVFYSF